MVENENTLNLKQELFCKLYASDKEFFGNGVFSYAKAYELEMPKSYATAKVRASQLLTNTNILKRISDLLDIYVNDVVVDKQLAFLITQNADFRAKISAISEYNKVRGRITEKHKLKFEGISDESLTERAAELIAGIVSDKPGIEDPAK